MTREEGLRSIGLFVDEVMPALRSVIPGSREARSPESITTGP
jgi:hypothetical protein